MESLLVKHAPYIAIIHTADSAESARQILESSPDIQVLFLDIQMPREDGISLLDSLGPIDAYPVFVTSHAEYAIEAIKLNAFDYLLKPIQVEHLVLCLNRIIGQLARAVELTDSKSGFRYIEVKSTKGARYIEQGRIYCLRASGSYTEIITENENILLSKNLKSTAAALDPSRFLRVHNSYVINLNEVSEFINEGTYIILNNGLSISCSPKRKSEILDRIRKA